MLLSIIFSILIVCLSTLFFIQSTNYKLIKSLTLITTGLVFFLSLFLLISFDLNSYFFQYCSTYLLGLSYLNINLSLGLDGISIFFFILSAFLIFLCVLFLWEETESIKEYMIAFVFLDLLLLLVFSVLDIILFYIFFEAILIPMYLIIGVWGSRERKVRAVYLFFFYTLIGSLCMLVGLLYIYATVGNLNFEYLLSYPFTFEEQYWLWLAFFLSFSSKVPMFPLHIWLPEAHVEAPTVGSVLLAGILLKLGVYGFIRFSLTLFTEASLFFCPLVYTLSIMGIIYASFSAIRQTDIKRIIAYSSIAHMNLVVLGIFSFNNLGFEGAVLQSISHGFVAGALFLLIGILYNRYHSRFLYYYGGIVHLMPIYSIFFLIFTMSNIALPGTSSFIGEFLLLSSIYKMNSFIGILSTLGVILCGIYSLWLSNRILYGNLKLQNTIIFKDLSYREFFILFPLLLFVLVIGIYPKIILNYLHLVSVNISFNSFF